MTLPVLLGACAIGPTTFASPSPSATPPTPAYAVLVHQVSNEQGLFGGAISLGRGLGDRLKLRPR